MASHWFKVLLSGAVVLAASACPSSNCQPACSEGYACQSGTCVSTASSCAPACGSGYTCQAGACVPTASSCSPDCSSGYTCQAGTCVPTTTSCSPACGSGYTCQAGTCIPTTTNCLPACGSGSTCQAGACIPTTSGCSPACGSGYTCQAGACIPTTSGCSPACGSGYTCQAGACVPTGCVPACGTGTLCQGGHCVATNSTGWVGKACTADSECPGGICLTKAPGGYCSKQCSGGTSQADALCPSDAQCMAVSETASVCLHPCSTRADCRSGYACAPAPVGSVCIPACTNNQDCATGSGCNQTTGLCDTQSAPKGALGWACAANSDCASGFCATEAATSGEFPGGYCLAGCTAAQAANNDFCEGKSGLCLELSASNDACLEACTTSVDCRPQYMCSASAGIANSAGYGICIPRCEYYACGQGKTCDTSVGLCVDATNAPTDGVRHVAIGTVQAGTTVGTAGAITVALESGDTGFSLTIAPQYLQSLAVITKVVAPNGDLLFDLTNPTASTIRVANIVNGVQGFLLPNSPRSTPTVGTYHISIANTVASTPTTVDAFIRKGTATGGSLPLHLWFFNGKGPTAATAQTDTKISQALSSLKSIYEANGITISPVAYHDVPAPYATQLSTITNQEAQEPELMQVAKDTEGINIFFPDQIQSDDPRFVLYGASRGIPGPYNSPGLPHGGITLSYLAIPADQIGMVMAHEMGHYLGLFHTTEREGTAFDSLSDTPECPASRDVNGDKWLGSSECIGYGSDNLMFWEANTQRTVSAQQRFVLQANPMVH